jgi:hypothetical protein
MTATWHSVDLEVGSSRCSLSLVGYQEYEQKPSDRGRNLL